MRLFRSETLVVLITITTVVAAAPLAVPAVALAQGTGARVQSPIYGANRSGSSPRDRLNVTLTATESIDTEAPPELEIRLPGRRRGGLSTLLIGGGTYAHQGRRFRIAAKGSSAFRYYNDLSHFATVGHTVGFGALLNLDRVTSFQIDQRAAYTPSLMYQLFPVTTTPELGDSIDTAPDYDFAGRDSYQYQSKVTLGRRVARRTSLSGSAAFEHIEMKGVVDDFSGRAKLDNYRLEGSLTQNLRRSVSMAVGYAYRTGDFGIGVTQEHRISIGASYSRPLSRSRRFVVSANVAPSTIKIPASPPTAAPIPAGRIFRLQGAVSVNYPLRHNWVAAGTVQRGIEYLPVFPEPVFSNGGRFSVSGLLTRRMDMSVSAAFVSSESPISISRRINSRTGNVRLGYAVSRHLLLYSEYVYYSYDLSAREDLPVDLPSMVDQHGFRIGATLWASPF
jgi:hypothetical protein